MNRTRTAILLTLFCACTFLIAARMPAGFETPTLDEYVAVPAGLSYWTHHDFRLDYKNPPLIKLITTFPLHIFDKLDVSQPNSWPDDTGPLMYGHEFERRNVDTYFDVFHQARWMPIFFALATAALLFIWANNWCGPWPAAFATLGFLFSPTVLTHGHLATVDMGATFFIFLLCFALARIRTSAAFYKLIGIGFLIGLAMTAKFTTVLLAPIVLAWWIYELYRERKSARHGLIISLKLLAFVSVGFIVAVNLVYGFQDSAQIWPDFALPFPPEFWDGFWAKSSDMHTTGFESYLLGTWSAKGWWSYYLIAFLFKEPVLSGLLLLALPFVFYQARPFKREWLYVVGPFLAIVLPMSFLNPVQIGIRYILPAYPFLFLMFAFLFKWVSEKWRSGFWLMPAAGLLWTLTLLFSAPNFISYFNSVALHWRGDTDLLLDSNLDWGQDLYRLKGLGSAEEPIALFYCGHVSPSLYGIHFIAPKDGPEPHGLVAISANFINGMNYLMPTPDEGYIGFQPALVHWLPSLKFVKREGTIFIFQHD